MDTEQLIRKLKIKNDIIYLNEEELKEKYGETKDKAEYFMHMFSEVFVNHAFFPTMIYDYYDKVREVLNDFNERYTKNTEFEDVYKSNIKALEREEHFAPTYETKEENRTQMYFLRTDELGITNPAKPMPFPVLNKLVLEKTEELHEAYNTNPHFPNKMEYEAVMKKAEAVGLKEDPMKELEIIDKYQESFPLLKLCHNPETLIAFNDILRNQEFADKDELSLIALNIIDFSLSYKPYNKDFDLKEFKTVAKATTKIIKNNEKKKEKAMSYKKHR